MSEDSGEGSCCLVNKSDVIQIESGEQAEDSSDKPPPLRSSPSLPEIRAEAGDSWNDWKWQVRNRFRSVSSIADAFGAEHSSGALLAEKKFPVAVTPYYASLIRKFDRTDPVYLQAVAQVSELYDSEWLKDDPLGEEADMPVPWLVHRYPDRALLLSTTMCSMYCRHCTRKRVAGSCEESITDAALEKACGYLREHPEIRDVIVSGGDPLTMSDSRLGEVLSAIRGVESVELIRIGTRVPVVMPMRVTNGLVRVLRRYHPLYVNTHFNHPNEVTKEAAEACGRLADAGIQLGNQTVLLRGVNDDATILESLFRKLLKIRVKPYYLFACDLVRGVEHFRTTLEEGVDIMAKLRGRLSGMGIPDFIVDAPDGGGKIPILPNYVVGSEGGKTVLKSSHAGFVTYPDPVRETVRC